VGETLSFARVQRQKRVIEYENDPTKLVILFLLTSIDGEPLFAASG
jgi:hypothetical protein